MSRLIVAGLPLATLQNAIERTEMLMLPGAHPYAAQIMTETLKEALEHAHKELIEKYVEVETMVEAIEHARKEGKE